ncbi:hypothetical protein SteCoe_25278 [Stentor coeruleus]|uniref:CSD domain-containing protein n=1 Tax=Stentor coeruleus TaxID=5963 RepID=A0A1R2BFP4_9CILI|nr:hypothetical protein SteCoe_25278 [Stentor coeruleus]
MKIKTSFSASKQVVPIDNCTEKRKAKNIFFNSSIAISELKQLGDIEPIPEEYDQISELQSWDRNQKQVERWLSKSSSARPSDPAKFHLELQKLKKVKIITPEELHFTPPPPGFPDKPEAKPSPEKRKRWVDFSSDSDLSGTPNESNFHPIKIPVQTSNVILKPPPLKPGLVKREKRSKFENERISENFYIGKLKFYNLKKRHGFITIPDGGDVFLVEDELALSGIYLRKFKDDVFKQKVFNLKFRIKTRFDNNKENRIATNIEILP